LCAALCSFLGNERIASFKASATGFEAKMREVAEVVDEAKATLKGLHDVAAMAGATLIDINAGMGRYGGGSTVARKDNRRTRILEALKSIGLDPQKLNEVSAADREWVNIDYVIGIFDNWDADRTFSNNERALWNEFSKPWQGKAEWPDPESCEATIKRLRIDDPVSRELLKDYQHYMKNGEYRRPVVWLNRGNWHDQRLKGSDWKDASIDNYGR
jgi:hypothetical protein